LTASRVEPAVPRAPARVLLVDDVAATRRLLRLVLGQSALFHVAAEATNGHDAIDLARRERPDLVLLDLTMPDMDGLDAIPRLLGAAPGAKVVVLSARDPAQTAPIAFHLGAAGYLEKGMATDRLLGTLVDLLGWSDEQPPAPRTEGAVALGSLEDGLLGAELLFESLLESAPDAIVIVGTDGLMTLVNRQTERLFGYERAELLGQPIEILLPDRSRAVHAVHRDEYFADPHARPMGVGLELHGRRRDRTEFPVEISLSPLRTEHGTIVSASIRDISDRVRIQEQLARQAAEMVERAGNFNAVASHELREPLHNIRGYLELLARRYAGKLDSDADQMIEYVLESSARLERLVVDMLEYSRVGATTHQIALVDLRRVLDEVVASVATQLTDTGASVTVGELPVVLGDEALLRQLMLNLVSNAIKFSDGPPVIQVASSGEPGFWRIAVTDRGIGIDPSEARRVFGMFHRLHSGDRYAGSGIGLALARQIVTRHGGQIWVEPAPGGGSSFLFTLPVKPPE
jgi:PAS domain S-box-containing protein